MCNSHGIEDEYHFIMNCSAYNNLQDLYLPHLSDLRKYITEFKTLMNANEQITHNLATYIYFFHSSSGEKNCKKYNSLVRSSNMKCVYMLVLLSYSFSLAKVLIQFVFNALDHLCTVHNFVLWAGCLE